MGLRPLHRACANLMLPSVRSLLNAGANPLLSDKRNRLPSEMMKCAKSSKRATSTKVRLARRETIRLIDKVLEEKIEANALRGLEAQLDTVDLEPITDPLDFDTLKL